MATSKRPLYNFFDALQSSVEKEEKNDADLMTLSSQISPKGWSSKGVSPKKFSINVSQEKFGDNPEHAIMLLIVFILDFEQMLSY